MSTKSNLSIAAATTFAVSLAASPLASAAENPFELTEFSSGYMVAEGEGNCGEGKCGEGKGEGEGNCGEGKCGEGDKGEGEGKCGEGKCGG